ncbi:hypothetical protein [Marimonas arenosa]|uniref:Uncharacterized protein n=1 Tax=Marimonas arenosa TaxID=1795305 RepID=A0AAE3W9A2_9RHOB|nr:hypothetical protein [Marimonas arenosa]MDQ2088454.1 hypothetical protein [Marimonas arenosa]
MLRYLTLLSLVIAAAGATIWVVVLAARAGQLNGATLGTLLPLVLLASLALRALRRDQGD